MISGAAPSVPLGTQEQIQQEYRQAASKPLRVRLFPDDAFEVTLTRPQHVGKGLQHSVHPREGLFCMSSWVATGPEVTVAVSHHPGLVFAAFNLSDRPLTGTVSGARAQTLPGDALVFSPQNIETLRYEPHSSLRWFNVFIAPSEFVLFAEDLGARIPASLVASLAGYGGDPCWHKSRMTAEMRAVLDRIESCPFHGSLKRLYLEGKVLELLALRLAEIPEAEPQRALQAPGRRQVERLHQARAIMAEHIQSPPTLQDLSAQVAMSATVLKRGFRELFGETVFEHVRNLRLEQARRMLLDGGAVVKETAHSVGYSSLSHFAKAYRRRFGVSPRESAARKTAAPDGPDGRQRTFL